MFTYARKAPLEIHKVSGRNIRVVRADLVPNTPLPPYLKMIELLRFVEFLKETENPKLIGYYAQDSSDWTRVIPKVCRQFGIKGIVGFGRKKQIPWFIQELKEGEVHWLKPNMYAICWNAMRRYVVENGGYMLPMGVDHPFVVQSIKEFFDDDPLPAADTFVVPVGSGVALSGILKHLVGRECQVMGVCTRPTESVMKVVRAHWQGEKLCLFKGDEQNSPVMPFPGHRFWERQTWGWLTSNLNNLPGKVCYINLGS